jgi:chromosome partitioning protein
MICFRNQEDEESDGIERPHEWSAMTRVIAVANLKGGVGKTTLSVNLASELSSVGSVQLVDADPQRSAHDWSLAGRLPCQTEVILLPEGRQAGEWVQRVRKLTADTIVIDLPAGMGSVTTAAMMIADLVIMPITPSMLDGRATLKALAPVRQVRAARRDGRPRCLLVPSRVDRRTTAGCEIEAALHELGEPVGPAVSLRSAFVDAASAGTWIGAQAPRTAAHIEIVVLAAVVDRLAVAESAAEPVLRSDDRFTLRFFPFHPRGAAAAE